MPEKKSSPRYALVLSGGGARGAYEAGVIHYIRTMLPSKIRFKNFDILCGNSIGAVNTAFLASTAHDPNHQGRKVCEHWENMREENLYRRDLMAFAELFAKLGKSFVANIANKKRNSYFAGILDNSPLLDYLNKTIQWNRITKNIQQNLIHAVSIVATNVFTGKPELFIDKSKEAEYTGDFLFHLTRIQPEHILASAAIPVIFSPKTINGNAYIDGGLCLNTPLSPAIHLGADKILVIELHGPGKEKSSNLSTTSMSTAEATLSQILGRVMDSLFVNRVQADLGQLDRINRFIQIGEKLHTSEFTKRVNAEFDAERLETGKKKPGFRHLEVLSLKPSENLGEIFSYCYERRRDDYFSTFEKWVFRFFNIDPTSGNEFLSYISFMPYYLKTLLYLGFEDAKNSHQKLVDFFED